jgi:hypothetical protein
VPQPQPSFALTAVLVNLCHTNDVKASATTGVSVGHAERDSVADERAMSKRQLQMRHADNPRALRDHAPHGDEGLGIGVSEWPQTNQLFDLKHVQIR